MNTILFRFVLILDVVNKPNILLSIFIYSSHPGDAKEKKIFVFDNIMAMSSFTIGEYFICKITRHHYITFVIYKLNYIKICLFYRFMI